MAKSKHALRMKVSEHEEGRPYCAAVITFDDGTEVQTPISDFSELRVKASDHGLDMDHDVVASPEAIRWLKDQEGWPDDRETVGKV